METTRLWCVYVHINKINGKMYAGITSQDPPEKRWMKGKGYDKKLRFGRAIRKYGWDNFEHVILLSGLSESDAKSCEKFIIGALNLRDPEFGYNMTIGGDGAAGYKHTEETRRKISAKVSGENSPNFGKKASDETRSKIADKLQGNKNACGCVRSDETRSKMARSKWKPVSMLRDNEVVQVFDSALDAQNQTGISRKNISECCLGHRKHAGGYAWKFA